MTSAKQREADVMLPVYAQLDLDIVAADGVFLTTADGRQIMDMYGGHAVCSLGYNHPALKAALSDASVHFQSNAVAMQERAAAAEALLEIAPAPLARVFFANSGAEVNENALRIACMTTGRRHVVAIEHGFHGRTAAAAAVTWGSAKRWYGFPERPFDVTFVPRNDVDAIRTAITTDTAAVIVEPVQGVAGAFDFDPAYLAALAAAAHASGALVIADEVQIGCGRSGFGFATERYGFRADLLTVAKSLGGGFPCAALLTSAELASELRKGDLGTTFGGGPLAARAILAVLNTIKKERLFENVLEREAQLKALAGIGPVEHVSGLGLLIGLHVSGDAAALRARLLGAGILTGASADPAVIRLLPPLNLAAEHVDALIHTLTDEESSHASVQ